jgi:hypothetical protein
MKITGAPLHSVGQKVQQIAEVAGGIHTIWNTARGIYAGVQAAAPYMAAGARALSTLL